MKSLKQIIIENLVSHAKYELKKAGLFDKDSDYDGMLGKAVLDLIKKFSNQSHSGSSASIVSYLFDKLSKFQTLTPITEDPEEWNDISKYMNKTIWQSKRDPAIFSKDGGKTCYNIDDKEK